MKLIIITRPDFFEGETELVNSLFHNGLSRLHLRKPRAAKNELMEWIEHIAHPFRQRIVLHDHHDLALSYHLGGVHINSRNKQIPDWVAEEKSARHFTLSRSCHSFDELNSYKESYDYLFLSPIYDSISKEGYDSAFTRHQLSEAVLSGTITANVYALGGVSFSRLNELSDIGFAGAAILGDLWQANDPIKKYEEAKSTFHLNDLLPF